MSDAFTIKTEVFEGPLDLLLSLIEKRKLFINDISLSRVADDYIEYVKTLESLPMNATAQFILIASTLLLIKSKSLLPTLSLTEEEQGSIEDLENRLVVYKRYKDLSVHIADRFNKNPAFLKSPQKNFIPVFSPDASTNKASLLESIRNALASIPKIELLPKVVVQKIVSLEEMIERLSERITSSLKLTFTDFANSQTGIVGRRSNTPTREERVAIIVSFLAMLELVKQGAIHVVQHNSRDEIEIETTALQVPNYSEI